VETYAYYPDRSRIVNSSTEIGNRLYSTGGTKTFYPSCGDHELVSSVSNMAVSSTGPMFYPYSACQVPIFQVRDTNFNQTVAPIPDRTVNDERYHSVDGSVPITLDEHHSLWVCYFDHTYGVEKKVGSNLFKGSASTRYLSDSDVGIYTANNWTLPKFGNRGREMLRLFLSTDRLYCGTTALSLNADRWVPCVITYPSTQLLVSSIFSEDMSDINPLSFLVCSNMCESVSERVDENSRFTYSELFEKVRSAGEEVMPLKNYYYVFKMPGVVWSWREEDKQITRASDVNDKFSNMTFSVPDYILPDDYAYNGSYPPEIDALYPNGWPETGSVWTDIEGAQFWRIQDEIRLRPTEGYHTVSFIAPMYGTRGPIDDNYGFKLDNGPLRTMDLSTGELLNEGIYNSADVDKVVSATEAYWALYDEDNKHYMYVDSYAISGTGTYHYFLDPSILPTVSYETYSNPSVDFTYCFSTVPKGLLYDGDGKGKVGLLACSQINMLIKTIIIYLFMPDYL
jgi:hypothetical protein